MSGFEENRQTANYRDSLTRLPELANKVIRKNIQDELEKLKNAESWQRDTGRSSETIVKYPEFRIVLIRVKPGIYMSHHCAKGPISAHSVLGLLSGPKRRLPILHKTRHEVQATVAGING